MQPPTLRELQLRLRGLVADAAHVHPDRVAAEVAALGIRDDGRLSAAARVGIYAEMYLVRLRDALAQDFPALHGALGDDAFATLVRHYVRAHPSDRPSLRDLGRHLPGFAWRHPELLRAPWQAELAGLEWAMVEAFDAREQRALATADLDALPAEAWPDLRIEPVASLVLLACAAPVDVLRERLLAGEEPCDAPDEPVLLRVWREGATVFHRRMDLLEAAALRWIFRGVSFAELCTWLGEGGGQLVDPAATALRLLHGWLADELLVAPA